MLSVVSQEDVEEKPQAITPKHIELNTVTYGEKTHTPSFRKTLVAASKCSTIAECCREFNEYDEMY